LRRGLQASVPRKNSYFLGVAATIRRISMPDSDENRSEVFDLGRLRQLLELMKEFDLGELDLKQDEQQIRLARSSGGEVRYVNSPQSFAPPLPNMAPAPSAAIPAAPAPAVDNARTTFIRSPMVGTFYSRANPKAEPFLKIGDQVLPETTACIIEAMKVFNEIPAEVRGRVVAVLVEDEEAVDFGKPLYKIETDA